MKPFERERSVDESLRIAEETVRYFGLETRERVFGDAGHPKTHQRQLLDSKRGLAFYGLGKGIGQQSRASALYEALEHFALFDFAQRVGEDPNSYWRGLPCVEMKSVHDGGTEPYPLFLLDPRYAKKPASIDPNVYADRAWRASDSGTASGTSAAEAGVHALNELIERHAYSKFLAAAFLTEDWVVGAKLIRNQTLPDSLRAIVKSVEQIYRDEVMIFEMTNELNVPTYFASLTRQNVPLQPRGCGASLSASYAVERAVLEALQPLQVPNEHMIENQRQIIRNFDGLPHLQRCAIADPLTLKGRVEVADFSPAAIACISVSDQLDASLQKLTTANLRTGFVEIANLETGYYCARYVIPNFDDFYLVQAGKRVLPKRRIATTETISFCV